MGKGGLAGMCTLAVLAACSAFGASPSANDPPPDSEGGASSGGEGGTVEAGTNAGGTTDTCNPSLPFGAPIPFPDPIKSDHEEYSGFLTDDRLLLLFSSSRDATAAIFGATRPTTGDAWTTITRVDKLDTGGGGTDSDPIVSNDLLTVYFDSRRNGGTSRIWFAKRPNAAALDFTVGPALVAGLGVTSSHEPWLVETKTKGDHLYFASSDTGNNVLYYVASASGAAAFANAAPMTIKDPSADLQSPVLPADEKTIYFASTAGKSSGDHDVYVATRDDPDSEFGDPSKVDGLATGADEFPTWVSKNGCALIVERGTLVDTKKHLYYVERGK